MTIKLKNDHFTAANKVFSASPYGLTGVFRAILQHAAAISASSVAALTDSTGAAASTGTIPNVPALTPVATLNDGADATDTILFTGVGTANDTLTVNGTVTTLVASGATGVQANIGGTAALTAANVLATLQASADAQISKFSYSLTGATITATDKTGGVAGNSLTLAKSSTAITLGSSNFAGGTDLGVQKAAFETGVLTFVNAFKEVVAQANALHAVVPALDGVLVDSMTGTAADGTVNALTIVYTGVDTSFASVAGANAVLASLEATVSQLRYHVNKLAVACGVTPLVDLTAAVIPYATITTIAEPVVSTGIAVGGTNATTDAGFNFADAIAQTVLLAKGTKELVTTLNACRSATGGVLAAVAA